MVFCALLLTLTSSPAWGVCRPENRVGGSPVFSSDFASQESAKPIGTPSENGGCGYDFASGVHKYLYCQGNPVDNCDPSGLLAVIYTTIGKQLNVLTGKTTGRIIYVGTAKGLINQFKALPNGSIREIDFIGHGNPCVQSIDNSDQSKETISVMPVFGDWKPRISGNSIHNVPVLLADVLNGKMVAGGTILLEGCQVAGKNLYDANAPNICQAVSIAIPNVSVSGSTWPTYKIGDYESPEGHEAWWGSMRTYRSSPTVTISPSSLNVMENFGMGLP